MAFRAFQRFTAGEAVTSIGRRRDQAKGFRTVKLPNRCPSLKSSVHRVRQPSSTALLIIRASPGARVLEEHLQIQRSCNASRVQVATPRVPRSGGFRIRSRNRALARSFSLPSSINLLIASAIKLAIDWFRDAANTRNLRSRGSGKLRVTLRCSFTLISVRVNGMIRSRRVRRKSGGGQP